MRNKDLRWTVLMKKTLKIHPRCASPLQRCCISHPPPRLTPFLNSLVFLPYSWLGQCPERMEKHRKMLLIFYARTWGLQTTRGEFSPFCNLLLNVSLHFFRPFASLTLSARPDFPFFIDFFRIPCGIFLFCFFAAVKCKNRKGTKL